MLTQGRKWLSDPLNLIALVFVLFWTGFILFKRPIGDYGVETDFYGDFVPTAKRWMDGEPSVMSGFRGPFYYLLLGVLGTIANNFFLVGKFLSVLGAGLGLRVAGAVFRRLWTPAAAISGTLFIAANSVFLEFSYRACTDMVFWLLMVGCLAVLLTGERAVPHRWIAAGVLAGAAWLTRYNGVVLLPAAVLIALVAYPPRTSFRPLLGYLAAWLLTIAPWSLFLWNQTGDPFWNQNHLNIALEVYPSTPSVGTQGNFMSEVRFASLAEVARVYPAQFFQVLTRNSYEHFLQDISKLVGTAWAIAAFVGVAAAGKKWFQRKTIAFFLTGLLVYGSLLPVFYSQRFMLPLLLWWAALFGLMGGSLIERLRRFSDRLSGRSHRLILRSLVVLVLGVLAATSSWTQIDESTDPASNKTGPEEILKIAEAVREAGYPFNERTPIAARKPHIGYYLDAPVMGIPLGTLEEFREAGAHYLLVTGAEVNWSTSLRPLLAPPDPSKLPSIIKMIGQVLVPAGNNEYRAANLYAVTNPLPWTPPERKPPRRDVSVIEGLNRLDSMRVRLARWYLVWDPKVDVQPLLALLSDEAGEHEETLFLVGDSRLIAKDVDGARRAYTRVLRNDPGNGSAVLRVATTHLLKNEIDGAIESITLYRTMAGEEFTSYMDAGLDLITEGHYAAAVAALQAEVNEQNPQTFLTSLKVLGKALSELGWFEQARAVYLRFLDFFPDDEEVKLSLKRINAVLSQEE